MTHMIGIGGGSTGIRVVNNVVQCTSCGADVAMDNAQYDYVAGIVTVITESGATAEKLTALIRDLEAAQKAGDLEAGAAAAVQRFPQLRRYLPKNSGDLAAWVMVVMAALALLMGGGASVNIDIHDVTIKIIEISQAP